MHKSAATMCIGCLANSAMKQRVFLGRVGRLSRPCDRSQFGRRLERLLAEARRAIPEQASWQKVAVWETQDILKQRGAFVDSQAIRRILDKILDVEPEHE